MAIIDEVLNGLLNDYHQPKDLLGKNGLLKQLQKRVPEKAKGAELTAGVRAIAGAIRGYSPTRKGFAAQSS